MTFYGYSDARLQEKAEKRGLSVTAYERYVQQHSRTRNSRRKMARAERRKARTR